MRYASLPHSHRPSAAIAVRSTNLQCQTPLGANVLENRVHRYAGLVLDAEVEQVVHLEQDLHFPAVLWLVEKSADADPACDFSEKNRLIEEYNGCTRYSPA